MVRRHNNPSARFISPLPVNSCCPECRGIVPADFRTCDAVFSAVLSRARDLGGAGAVDSRLFRVVVDVFAMQHPARSCESPKSYAAHLTGLCCAVEYGMSARVYASLQRWLNGRAEEIGIRRPWDLDRVGDMTVGDVHRETEPGVFEARVHEWAACVWAAYHLQHGIVREWFGTALGGRHGGPG
jgi:hypothetical protein